MVNIYTLTRRNQARMTHKQEFKYQNLINTQIEIPTRLSTNEICNKLINDNKLRIHVKNDLASNLENFIQIETQNLKDNFCLKLLDEYKTVNEDELLKFCLLNNRIVNEIDYKGTKTFTQCYHELIHSDLMYVILNKERDYMIEINDLIVRRDKELNLIEITNTNKLNEALKLNNKQTNDGESYIPDKYISKLANDNVDLIELEKSKWDSKILNTKENQKRDFQQFIFELHKSYESKEEFINQLVNQAILSQSSTIISFNIEEPRIEEPSYTIQLGAQLKTTHNLRLLRRDLVNYLCSNRFNLKFNLIEPQTIQNAMCLNTNNLCAGVILVDRNISKSNGTSNKFARICEESTEFHFQTYEQQLVSISECVNNLNSQGDINVGDFYITKHSNLSKIHLMFHLACDDDTLKQKSDLSSRHSAILGLRNILKACCRYNVNTLTIPLLLTHEMSEEMTINWVMKRAELVLKCLKGFMIELWGSQDSRNLQFVVPDGLLDETFVSVSNLISTIFRELRIVDLS